MKRARDIGVVVGGLVLAFVGGAIVRHVQRGSEARVLLERLALPEGVTNVSSIDVVAADGPMPEIASRSFDAPGDESALRRFFLERCRALGLSEPSAEHARIEPDVLCKRARPGRGESVSLFAECARDACGVSLQVHY
ncbi:MAG TPA: hypothetical protein VNN80_02590 [Polyangiaceae bacterium]|nr:hypothetical protein [Polyangiaceae bacterium]